VVRHHEHIAQRLALRIRSHRVDDSLHCVVRGLVRVLNVFLITRNLCGILLLVDARWVLRVRRLPQIGQQELVFRSIRLFDVDHHQIRIWILLDRP
jgi:hypothetical protein